MADPNAPFDNTKPPQSPTPAPGPGPAPAPGVIGANTVGLVSAESPDAKTMAMLCHLLAIFTGWIAPLIIWLMKKDQSPFVNQQGKEALNFELTLIIGFLAGALTICIGIGIFIIIATYVVNIVFGIMSTITVNKGQPYRYPICIRFIK
jgi:hypothetical protein